MGKPCRGARGARVPGVWQLKRDARPARVHGKRLHGVLWAASWAARTPPFPSQGSGLTRQVHGFTGDGCRRAQDASPMGPPPPRMASFYPGSARRVKHTGLRKPSGAVGRPGSPAFCSGARPRPSSRLRKLTLLTVVQIQTTRVAFSNFEALPKSPEGLR